MKRSVYRELDYAFGQQMLTLRMSIGLTQAGLAEFLGISRRAVAEWEAGASYPKAERLKQLIELGVRQQAFPAGCEEEEIRAFWHAAHQKVLLDERWLQGLLAKPTFPRVTVPVSQALAR
jgi:transcriptional regulator with XRE-family HTH domain